METQKRSGILKFSLCVILLALFSPHLLAQNAAKYPFRDLSIKQNSKKVVDVELYADQEISNLLVMVSDSLGNTLFLDNQYRFKGQYKFSMDMKKQQKGNYSIDIITEEERVVKKLRLE